MKFPLSAVTVFCIFGAMTASAANLFWTGAAGDGAWTTVGNWAADEAGIRPAAACPGAKDVVGFLPSRYPDGKTTVSIPDGTEVLFINLRDNKAPGRIRLVGTGADRARLLVSHGGGIKWNGTAPGCGVVLEMENLSVADTVSPLFDIEQAPDGNGTILRNCSIRTPRRDVLFPGCTNTVVRVEDCTVECAHFKCKDFFGTGCSMVISNSTIAASGNFVADMPGLRLDVTDSKIDVQVDFKAWGEDTVARFLRTRLEIHSHLKIHGARRSFSFVDSMVGLNGYDLDGGPDGELHIRNSTVYLNRTGNLYGKIYLENGKLLNTNGLNGASSAAPTRFIVSGRGSQFRTKRLQGGTVHFDFIVPAGGYETVPVGADGILAKSENNFLNGCSGGTVNVLPESPAAREPGSHVYPLIYVYTGGANRLFSCAAAAPTTLPGGRAQFLGAPASDVPMADVSAQPESWWQPVAAGARPDVAGLAVKFSGN